MKVRILHVELRFPSADRIEELRVVRIGRGSAEGG